MKKRIFTLIILLAVSISAILSLASCEKAEGYSGSGFTVTNENSPYLVYYGDGGGLEKTEAILYVKVTNDSENVISGLSFYAYFRDSSGRKIDSRLCRLSEKIEPGESVFKYYEFNSYLEDDDNAFINGEASSVTFEQHSVTFKNGASKKDDGEKSWGILETIIAVLCVGALVLGIWLTYDGFYLGLDWLRRYPEDIAKPVFGILLCVASVGWAIVYYFFIW